MAQTKAVPALRDTARLLGRIARLYKSQGWAVVPGMVFHSGQLFVINFISSLLLSALTASILSGQMSGVLLSMAYFLALFFGYMGLLLMTFYIMLRGLARVNGQVKGLLFDRLLRRRLAAAGADHTGDALSRLNSDANLMLDGVFWPVESALMALIGCVGSAIVVFAVDLRLGALATAIGLLSLGVNALLAGPFRRVGDSVQRHTSQANQRLSDMLSGALTVRLFGLFARKDELFARQAQIIASRENRRTALGLVQAAKGAWQEWASVAGILSVGFILVARGELTLPSLMLVPAMAATIVFNLSSLGSVLTELQGSLAGAARVLTTLDAPVEDLRTALPAPEPRESDWALSLENVSFRYGEAGEPALEDLTLGVRPGEMVALVGASGSGKSTLFRLLLGLYTPDTGDIRLYGRSITESSLAGWRRQMAYVAQEAPLFDASLHDNIAMGMGGDADPAAVEQAARAADIWDFIEGSGGPGTPAGELGARLSGGQRQRIVIARALMRDAPILLLDEATSSLDTASERQVQRSIDRLVKGRTVLVAAHRLSTIKNADRIVVLERGRIVEQGSHRELLRRGGTYARLWKSQAFV